MNIKKIFVLINLSLAVLIIWMAYNIFRTWRGGGELKKGLEKGKVVMADTHNLSSPKEKKIGDYLSVIEQDIFKTAQDSREAPSEKEEEIEITALDIKLRGVVLRKEEPSFAVIYDEKSKKEDIYYLNDYVQGARVVQVLPDRIILSRGGKQEALMLELESSPESKSRGVIKGKRPIPRKVKPGR